MAKRILNVFAALVLALMLAIVLQVGATIVGLNPLVELDENWPLVGDAVTLNSLLDFQWHLLVIVALLPAGLVWLRNGHVRVDFLYQRFGEDGRSVVDVIGNLLFALPFFALATPAAWSFAARAWRSDEGSANGGLVDTWLIKGMLPLGLALLAFAIAIETVQLVRRLCTRLRGPQ